MYSITLKKVREIFKIIHHAHLFCSHLFTVPVGPDSNLFRLPFQGNRKYAPQRSGRLFISGFGSLHPRAQPRDSNAFSIGCHCVDLVSIGNNSEQDRTTSRIDRFISAYIYTNNSSCFHYYPFMWGPLNSEYGWAPNSIDQKIVFPLH